MSYCRWSSMNFKCDLYCYEHVDGTWTTHVAGNKVVTPIIPGPPHRAWVFKVPALWRLWSRLHHLSIDIGIRRDIGLKYDGETFKDESLEDFRLTLTMLRGEGYRFPDYVLEAVDEEIRERASAVAEMAH